jgi:Helicase conserved C-terminal domain
MDALDLQVKRDHRAANAPITAFDARLISGGIDMRTIQQIMVEAEAELPPGSQYPDIDRQMRSIIATSAISHGVDVDRFNSMFFAGLPSDVAEYIQASSRVGRTHVGFVMLVPTPQSRRDRYVVETHDIFHRFLERMIAPPAVQRWASNAIKRVTASVIQSWAVLKEAQGFQEAPDDRKHLARRFDIMRQLNALAVADALAMREELGSYMLQAIGYGGRGPNGIGRPVYREVYRDLADRAMNAFVSNVSTFNSQIRLSEFWSQNSGVQAPMTSLRDVDEAGLIVPSTFDPYGAGGNRRVRREAFVDVMKAIRTQKGTAAETDREGEEPAREAPR